ncbi:MAG TPA: SDR family NAD(P)-dependent oxidoreductase [Vicinamibacterales bacterium]|nr:SDR family NAD(P)-dependent oxidoreductase [Vicinamibacterales bacterium]
MARSADRLREAAATIAKEYGVRAEWIAMNLANASERDGLASAIAARGEIVDLLVNDAGIGTVGRFHELPVSREIDLVRLNVETVVALCGAFVPDMVRRGRGAILNVASVSGFMPVPRQASYCASKAFVLNFTDSLRLDLHGTGVTATALSPGPVKTAFGGLLEGLPDVLFVDPARVAREAIDGLERGRRTVIPGAANALNAMLGRYTPRGVFLSYARRFWPG